MTDDKVVSIKVFAGAKKEKAEWEGSEKARLFVREPAQHNLANTRVRELVAKHFGVPIGAVSLLTGHRSPNKKIRVTIKVR